MQQIPCNLDRNIQVQHISGLFSCNVQALIIHQWPSNQNRHIMQTFLVMEINYFRNKHLARARNESYLLYLLCTSTIIGPKSVNTDASQSCVLTSLTGLM